MTDQTLEQAKQRLLLITDDAFVMDAMRAALAASELSHLRAEEASAEDGLTRVLSANWDCVLLDARLASGLALDVYSDLLARSCAERPPVILLTGADDQTIIAEAKTRGVQDHLAKATLNPSVLGRLIAGVIAISLTERTQLAQHALQQQASLYDQVTGLPNRTLFVERLEQALRLAERQHLCFAVLMIDCTRKEADGNDVFWRDLAACLNAAVRRSDTVARLGEHEFAVLLTVGNVAGAERVGNKILQAITTLPSNANDANGNVTVGLALYPDHGRTREELLRAADGALYRARRGRIGLLVAPERDESWQGVHKDLGESIAPALEQDEFVLKYQPVISLSSGKMTSVEALVRWQHPELGLLSPAEFLHLARDETINTLSLRVMDRALDQVRKWRDQGLHVALSVNLPMRILELSELHERIVGKLREHALTADCLTLELRDERLTEISVVALKSLHLLVTEGVKFAIDDFGIGTASMQALRELPMEEMKIDRSFVAGASRSDGDAAIIRAIVELGRGFGRRVVAKGIESDEVWALMATLGCEYGQGFRFARPLDAEELAPWCDRWQSEGHPPVAALLAT